MSAFLGTSTDFAATLAGYDRIWWLIVGGGVITSLLVLPMRTAAGATGPGTGHAATARQSRPEEPPDVDGT